MSANNNNLDTQPWYQQGWPWALIAIPLLTVVAGVITFMIANDTTDSLVKDDYYKEGLAINRNFERIALAANLSLVASIELQSESNLITLILQSESSPMAGTNKNNYISDELTLNFSHPTLKSEDRTIQLAKLSGNEYVGEFSNLADAYWHVSVEDKDEAWLMKSRWRYPNKTSLIIDSKKP